MKSLSVTIQMKTIKQYFPVVLFVKKVDCMRAVHICASYNSVRPRISHLLTKLVRVGWEIFASQSPRPVHRDLKPNIVPSGPPTSLGLVRTP